MAASKGTRTVTTDVAAEDAAKFSEVSQVVLSGNCKYDDLLKLLDMALLVSDEEKNAEVTGLLCDLLDSKIPAIPEFVNKLKLESCVWVGKAIPLLVSHSLWKRAVALKLIDSIQKLVGSTELSQDDHWESLRNILIRHTEVMMQMVSEKDMHWLQVWMVYIDLLGTKLAHNTNRILLNKLFKVLSPFKEDFRSYRCLQQAVREEAFKLATVSCWQKVVDFWLLDGVDVPLNHVTTIVRFFKKAETAPSIARRKCVLLWRVVCKLPPGHKGIQPSIEQLFLLMLQPPATKTLMPPSGLSSVGPVADVLSEMLALMLGAHLCPDNGLTFDPELLLPRHELIGVNSLFLPLILQCFEKVLVIDPALSDVRPNVVAMKAGFSCFLSKINSNSSSELINCVLKLPFNICAQVVGSPVIINNCIDIVVKSVVTGPHCFGDHVMVSSKYFSGPKDVMTGSPTLMLTQLLLDKSRLPLLDLDITLSVLESLFLKGNKTALYVQKVMSLLKSLGDDVSVNYLTVLKVWQTLVLTININYRYVTDFTKETSDLGWIYQVILFPLNCFKDQHACEIAEYMGSKHQSDLHFTLLASISELMNTISVCEALASKLDKLLPSENESSIAAVVAATLVLVTAARVENFPCGKRYYLSSTFKLVANALKTVKTLKCTTESVTLDLIKTVDTLSACLDGNNPTLTALTPLVVSLLTFPVSNKTVTESIIKTAQTYIEKVEKEYCKYTTPSIIKIKNAFQLFEVAAKMEETQANVLTPKRFPTRKAGGSPVVVKRITPVRVSEPAGTDKPPTESAAPEEAPPREPKKFAKKLYETPQGSSKASPLGKPAAPRGPLTKRQKEKMRERQDNIPALYLDLTQESQAVADSQPELTQDSSSLVIPQRFGAATATDEPKVENRPFASVVQVPEVAVDPVIANEKPKAIYDIFKRDKKAALLPIHLKKVHPSRGTRSLDETVKPAVLVPVTSSQADRPFQAFSPANKKKHELSQLAAVDVGKPHAAPPQKSLPAELDSQDFIADSQTTAPVKDNGGAFSLVELNSSRSPSQRKATKKQTEDFLWGKDSKQRSMKRKLSTTFEESDSDQSACKKQVGITKKINARLSALPGNVLDDGSDTSTDSGKSGSQKRKSMELQRLRMDLVLNENPLPVKRTRKSGKILNSIPENNTDIKEDKPAGSNSDCDSVTSDVSSGSDILSGKNKRRRGSNLLIPTPFNENKLIKKPATITKLIPKPCAAKESINETTPPIVEKLQPRAIVQKELVVELEPVTIKKIRKSLRNKAGADQASTSKAISSVNQTPIEAENFQPSNIPAVPIKTSALQQGSSIVEDSAVTLVPLVVEHLIPPIISTEKECVQPIAVEFLPPLLEDCPPSLVKKTPPSEEGPLLHVEERRPLLAEECPPSLVKKTPSSEECPSLHVVEDPALLLEDCLPPIVKEFPPLVVEEIPPSVEGECPPLVDVEIPPSVEEECPPLVVEGILSSVEKESPPLVVKGILSLVEEECPPSVEEECPPLVEEECPPLVEEECPPSVEEECPPSVEEECPPLVVEEILSSVEDEGPPLVVKEILPSVTKECLPLVVEENPSLHLVECPLVAEECFPMIEDECSPLLAGEDHPSLDVVKLSHSSNTDVSILENKEIIIEEKKTASSAVPLMILDCDEVEGGIEKEIGKDLQLENSIKASEITLPKPDCGSGNLMSDKENKIVEESQDSIVPCSQLELGNVKLFAAKRKQIRPKILTRFSAKADSVTEVLSPVSFIPETQILDTQFESLDGTGQSEKPVASSVEPQSTLPPAEIQTTLEADRVPTDSSKQTEGNVVLPENSPDPFGNDVLFLAMVAGKPLVVDLAKDVEETCNPTKVHAEEVANAPRREELISPPRPGPKVMENLSPSMLRLLNSTQAQKNAESAPICRSRKMLKMACPGRDASMPLKPQTEEQEITFYVDQSFPPQECVLGADGTPVMRNWKKCMPSPSSVPARSSLKCAVAKDLPGKNRKLCFPFEPTTKVLYYYEKKNSKCNGNISMKIKKRLKKRRRLEREQDDENEQEKEFEQTGNEITCPDDVSVETSSTTLESLPVVGLSNGLFLPTPASTVVDASMPSIQDSPLTADEPMPRFAESNSAKEESTALSNRIIDLTGDIPLVTISDNMLPKYFCVSSISKVDPFEIAKCEPATSATCIDLTQIAPVCSVSPERSTVITISPLLADTVSSAVPTPSEAPAAPLTEPAHVSTLFEDSFHDYVAPTPLSVMDPELLNRVDPLYPDLVDCQQPIAFMVSCLTTPQWLDDLSRVLAERNIVTVGDFCRRTERQIDLLPIKGSHKVKTARRALDKYKSRLQIADASPKDLLKGLECNKYSKDVFNHLYPCTKNSVEFGSTQTCSDMVDDLNVSFVKNASPERLLEVLQGSGKLSDNSFVDKLVKNIEPSKYISVQSNSGLLDEMTFELANSINLLPSEVRMRHINTLLSHLKFKD